MTDSAKTPGGAPNSIEADALAWLENFSRALEREFYGCLSGQRAALLDGRRTLIDVERNFAAAGLIQRVEGPGPVDGEQ